MHPIERLRYVARAEGAGPTLLAREAAAALASIGDDPAGLVTGCRRLVDRHLTVGPMWWLAARLLSAADPAAEAGLATCDLDADQTSTMVAHLLPEGATVTVVGWPEQAAAALARRGDLDVLVVDCGGEGGPLCRRLAKLGSDATDIPEAGLGAAAANADVVLLEASALGPSGFVAPAGSRAAAAVARHAGVAVWLVAGAGRVLPGRLWDALTRRLDDGADPWDQAEEVVPLDLVDQVIGPAGAEEPAVAFRRADCPIAPELVKDIP